jgi:hypothetical protein
MIAPPFKKLPLSSYALAKGHIPQRLTNNSSKKTLTRSKPVSRKKCADPSSHVDKIGVEVKAGQVLAFLSVEEDRLIKRSEQGHH